MKIDALTIEADKSLENNRLFMEAKQSKSMWSDITLSDILTAGPILHSYQAEKRQFIVLASRVSISHSPDGCGLIRVSNYPHSFFGKALIPTMPVVARQCEIED
jgi:hypothetical protein